MKTEYGLVLPKSPIGKALAYSIKRWDKLSAYITDGKLHIDNNAAENSIRPIAIGRKNYLLRAHMRQQKDQLCYTAC